MCTYIYVLPSAQDEVSPTSSICMAEAGGQREYIGQPRAASGIEAGTRIMSNMIPTYITVYIVTIHSIVGIMLGGISQVVER